MRLFDFDQGKLQIYVCYCDGILGFGGVWLSHLKSQKVRGAPPLLWDYGYVVVVVRGGVWLLWRAKKYKSLVAKVNGDCILREVVIFKVLCQYIKWSKS